MQIDYQSKQLVWGPSDRGTMMPGSFWTPKSVTVVVAPPDGCAGLTHNIPIPPYLEFSVSTVHYIQYALYKNLPLSNPTSPPPPFFSKSS